MRSLFYHSNNTISIRDEKEVADKMVENLKRQLALQQEESEKALKRERELAMELVASLNKKAKEVQTQNVLIASLKAKCAELEDRNALVEEELERYTETLQLMVCETQVALQHFMSQ